MQYPPRSLVSVANNTPVCDYPSLEQQQTSDHCPQPLNPKKHPYLHPSHFPSSSAWIPSWIVAASYPPACDFPISSETPVCRYATTVDYRNTNPHFLRFHRAYSPYSHSANRRWQPRALLSATPQRLPPPA